MHFIIDLNDELKYDTPENVYINGDPAARTAADETYYTAENLEPDTEYMVKVTAVTADDENTVINTPIRTDKKGNVHNVLDEPYNAKGDGETLDTDAIQSAIDSCEENDIVLIPEGYTFLTGALDLKSNMTLEVNGTLLSSKNAEDFEKRDQTVDTDALKGGVTAGGAVYNAVQNVSMKNCRGIEFNNVRQSDGGIPFYSSDKAEFTVDGGRLEDIVPSFVSEIEAEKMNLSGYKYESNSAASAGACVSANDSGSGTAKAEFGGDDGIYDLTVQYFDENDGKAEFEVYVNDELIDSWTADQDLGSASADSKTLTTYTVENVTLKKGDVISITGVKETYDPARPDKLTLVVK